MKKSNFKHQKGMTLIELMVSMVVLVMLVSVAVPTMKGLFERKNVVAVGTFFERTIRLARTEALNRSAVVRIQPTSASRDWSKGWYLEYTKSDASVEVIRTFPALSGNLPFDSPTFNGSTLFEILPNGQVRTLGTFNLFAPSACVIGATTYQVLLSGALVKGAATCL